MPPPSASSGGLGALARSASLGARKKDPYSYSSDDVESGLGQMDMRGDRGYGNIQGGGGQGYAHMARPSYNGGGGGSGSGAQGQGQGYGAVGSGASGAGMDISMSSPGTGGASRPYSTSSRGGGGGLGMPPPPIPNHPNLQQYSRQAQGSRNDSNNSSPSRQPFLPPSNQNNQNPYVPRSSDPGPSIQIDEQPEWDYPRPSSNNQRMPSSSSFHSQPSSDLRSPFLTSSSDPQIPSPHSPLLNPYDNSSPAYSSSGMSTSPNMNGDNNQQQQQQQQQSWPSSFPASPGRPAQPPRSQSQQTYPASQPVTPGKNEGPPRGARDPRSKQPSPVKKGFRDVRGWDDLKPMASEKSNGRRADPLRPGKFLSVGPYDHILATERKDVKADSWL